MALIFSHFWALSTTHQSIKQYTNTGQITVSCTKNGGCAKENAKQNRRRITIEYSRNLILYPPASDSLQLLRTDCCFSALHFSIRHFQQNHCDYPACAQVGNFQHTMKPPLAAWHYHHHQQPLVSDAIVTIAAHCCLFRAAWLNSCRVAPHHCSMSSDHSRWGRPLLFEPSIIPNTIFLIL